MHYDYQKKETCEYDEFIMRGICAGNPSLSSLQEIILIYLKEMAYYLLKLKDLGANNEVIKEHIIEAISGIITNIDYNREHFQKLILLLAQDLSQEKTLYANLCYKENLDVKFLKTYFKQSKTFNISDILKKGEIYYIKRNTEYTSEQKNLFDIMLFLIKNICVKIIELKSYKKDYENAYNSILTLLSAINFEYLTLENVKTIIDNATLEYNKLVNEVSNTQEEFYGKRESVYIPFTPKTGKAILVSGIDMTQLEAILEATKGKNIDVYTHGMTMLMAHTLPKFKNYPNLVGHYGHGSESSLFDFAAFPGAILMTRYLFQKVEYLYRGRLFTTDAFAPSGIIKIENNDYKPLIEAALVSKGFTKEQQKVILRVGFRQKLLEEKVKEIIDKMKRNEIKHLYFVGILHHETLYKNYFDNFFKLMPKDCYAVALSHEKNEENILHVDSFYDYLLIYKVLDEISKISPLNELEITLFITKCDQYTITNIINFINMGVKHIFLCKCAPTLVSPALAEAMKKTFGVKDFSTPEKDIAITLAKE